MITVQFLAEWAVRSSILILSGALLLRILRVKDPSICLAVWMAALCCSLALPMLTAVLPTVPVAMVRVAIPHVAVPPTASRVAVQENSAPEQTRSHQDTRITTKGTRVASNSFGWASAAVIIYALVAGALLVRLCAGLFLSMRLFHGSRETGLATEGIEIRESNGVSAPVALGIIRSAIMLPPDWRQWNSVKLDAVLAHERSHLRRRDPAVQLLSAAHRALLWYSPLSWFLHKQIVRVAEDASDDAAVAVVRNRALYAEVLLDFIQRGVRTSNWLDVSMARYGRPDERINRILDGTALSGGVTRWSAAVILALGSPLAFVVAAAHPQNQSQAQTATGPVSRSARSGSVTVEVAAQAAPNPPARFQGSPPQKDGAAQRSPQKPLTFEAASVRPASPNLAGGLRVAPRGPAGFARIDMWAGGEGLGTKDPGRIHYPVISLKSLLLNAYDLENLQVQAPDWLDTAWFAIDATMPTDTTKDQFEMMLRNLLSDRFKLATHREMKESRGYSLVVSNNGPKMTESATVSTQQGDSSAEPFPQRPQVGQDGFIIAPRRFGVFAQVMGNRIRLTFRQTTMQVLANTLQARLKRPIVDATELTSKFDFILTFSTDGLDLGPGTALAPPSAGGTADAPEVETSPDIFGALQTQLGLKLEPKMVSVERIIVDHIEKTPTEN